jgi:hypothetical protein
MAIRDLLIAQGLNAVAVSLAIGHSTMFHISIVNLSNCIPMGTQYSDGSGRGLQFNIDRFGSYAIPLGHDIQEEGYVSEKWQLNNLVSGKDLLPFFNTILTGENHYENQKFNSR